MQYFAQDEKDALLQEEYDFDRNLVHKKYRAIVENAETERFGPGA